MKLYMSSAGYKTPFLNNLVHGQVRPSQDAITCDQKKTAINTNGTIKKETIKI